MQQVQEEGYDLGKFVPVDLFPYKIKNRSLFYDRNHPKNLHPESPMYSQYWLAQMKNYVEGKWINDEGTWVYMMPKLYFYINYVIIMDEKRNKIQPRLRDNEWILATYAMLVDGFSGFEHDREYTCHDLVRRVEEKEELDDVQLSMIPESCLKEDGTYKKFIYGWEYLTEHYLVKHKPSEPLGQPLYENNPKNGVVITCRSIGKSFFWFTADFLHEFLFDGSKTMQELAETNKRLLFGAGSTASPQLTRSIKNIQDFYYNMPGSYQFKAGPDGKRPKPYMGPMFKRVQGTWEVGGMLEHINKGQGGVVEHVGNTMQFVALTADKHTIGAGDRFRRIYVEEFGFLKNALSVHASNKDSVQVGKSTKVGSCVYLGTSGNMETIRQPKKIFDEPDAYDMASIPNVWKPGAKKRVGLFIPVTYQDERYKDENGNTRLELSLAACLRKREEEKRKDAGSYDKEVMYNPLAPDEMLRNSENGLLPKSDAANQLTNILDFGTFERRAMIGTLKYDRNENYGVRFLKDMTRELRPITEWTFDSDKVDKKGAFVMYEEPHAYIPEGLYYVVYDPTRHGGEGESLHSVIVYKHYASGSMASSEGTIVAEWIGRMDRLEDNYDMVIRIAKYFHATIFPETNVPGFVHWCNTNNHRDMLEGAANYLEKEINPNGKGDRYGVGFNMDNRKKPWALTKLANWLLEVREIDQTTGIPLSKNINRIISPRILDEIINYNTDDNFDHISSLLGLMLLLGKLEGMDLPEVGEPDADEYFKKYEKKTENLTLGRTRAKFLQY
jgi:hypothetical protein